MEDGIHARNRMKWKWGDIEETPKLQHQLLYTGNYSTYSNNRIYFQDVLHVHHCGCKRRKNHTASPSSHCCCMHVYQEHVSLLLYNQLEVIMPFVVDFFWALCLDTVEWSNTTNISWTPGGEESSRINCRSSWLGKNTKWPNDESPREHKPRWHKHSTAISMDNKKHESAGEREENHGEIRVY